MKRIFTKLMLPIWLLLAAFCVAYTCSPKKAKASFAETSAEHNDNGKLRANLSLGSVTKHLLDFSK